MAFTTHGVLSEGLLNRIPKHRWLPLADHTELWRTPAAQSVYDPWGPNYRSWVIGAQAHYSLLENIEKGSLWRYYMAHGFGLGSDMVWDMSGTRISINMIAMQGEDIATHLSLIILDDEHFLTEVLPQKLRR
ncbi:hypothetical protein ETB97_001078, partial [Aspergillus alliaceus]